MKVRETDLQRVGEMNLEVDYSDRVMHIETSDLLVSDIGAYVDRWSLSKSDNRGGVSSAERLKKDQVMSS